MTSNILASRTLCKIFPQISKLKSPGVLIRNYGSEIAKRRFLKTSCTDAISLMKWLGKSCNILQPGHKILDIGAASGAQSQFFAVITNSNKEDSDSDPRLPVGMVVAIDVNSFQDINGVHSLPNMDFLKQSSQSQIAGILGEGNKFDFVFSDIKSSEKGVKTFDESRMAKTILATYIFMSKHLKKGGNCIVKVGGAENNDCVKRISQGLFEAVIYYELHSKSKPEVYLLGKGFLCNKKKGKKSLKTSKSEKKG